MPLELELGEVQLLDLVSPAVMDPTAASPATATPRWLVSRAFDLTWFFGGGVLSLIVLALYFAGAPIVALWWIWLLAFDGPHIGAAFTRTYFDAEEWRRRPGLLLTSLLTFAVGPVFLALTVATGSQDPFLLFLAFATFYGYYHVVRQHYGFVALYNTINRDWGARTRSQALNLPPSRAGYARRTLARFP